MLTGHALITILFLFDNTYFYDYLISFMIVEDETELTIEQSAAEAVIRWYTHAEKQQNVIHCRPQAFTKNSELLSAYIGVLLMVGMAVYAR